MNTEKNVSLQGLNTFGISAQAREFARITSRQDLSDWHDTLSGEFPNPFILGGGSNILLTRDIDNLVLRMQIGGIDLVHEDENYFFVRAGGGVVWHEFVMDCIRHERAGVENLSLIPGSVGAAPMQNIGAYGVEIKDVFHELEAFHIREGVTRKFTLEECAFGYRESIFKGVEKGNWIIISVTFRLLKRPVFHVQYGAIQSELERMEVQDLSIRDVSKAVINIRRSKLPDPGVLGNAGSFFKNPVVSVAFANEIKGRYPDAPVYPLNETEVKLAAGWLIEQCGWKGKVVGHCGMHKDQALVLVNYGGATGQELLDMSTKVMDSVHAEFGVMLEREVNIV
jgi:UDP-N-acetylmuramate dehydrogenase